MEEIKERIKVRLSELNGIAPQKYSAMELHSQRGHLLERVQRQENRRYQTAVENQRKKLNTNLVKIDSYSAALKAEKDKRAAILSRYNLILEDSKNNLILEDQKIVAPRFQPINLVVPKPVVSVGLKPVRKLTRIYSRRRLRGNR